MSDKIRVLHIVTRMVRAGLECRLMDIYRNIDKTRIQFDFYTFRNEPGYFDDEILSLGGRVYYSAPISIKGLIAVPDRIKHFLIDHPEYKIVHAHMNQWCGIILKGAKNAGVAVRIAHSRTSLDKLNMKNIAKNIAKLSTNRYATHRFAVSEKAACWLYGDRQVKAGNAIIIPNSIDCKKYRYDANKRTNVRKLLGLRYEYTLVNVGNIRFEKNHKFLIDILGSIKHVEPESRLLIIGADGMNGEIQAYAAEKGLQSDVLFLGSRPDVQELLQAGDVFVFPSIYEGFPGAVLEAQAAGMPCVIADTITDEVCLTENIIKLPIDKGPDIWSRQIVKYRNAPRIDAYDVLCSKGYDIISTANWYEEFYLNAANAAEICTRG